MPYDPDSHLNCSHADSAGDDAPEATISRRQPRRLARLYALDAAALALLEARLDRIDRQAPLPHGTVAAVNELILAARRPLARLPLPQRPAPLRFDRVTAPGDAVVALFRLRDALTAAGEAMVQASLGDSRLDDKL